MEIGYMRNDGFFVLDPKEDFYDDLKALFAEPVDGELEQPSISSVGPFKNIEGKKIGTRSLHIKSKKTVQRLELQVPKKDGICTGKRRYLGPGCLVTERPMQRAIKSEDHGWASTSWLGCYDNDDFILVWLRRRLDPRDGMIFLLILRPVYAVWLLDCFDSNFYLPYSNLRFSIKLYSTDIPHLDGFDGNSFYFTTDTIPLLGKLPLNGKLLSVWLQQYLRAKRPYRTWWFGDRATKAKG